MIQIALFVGALITLLLGVFVLLNNPRSTLFRIYCIFSVFATAWILSNALTMGGIISLQNDLLLFLSRLITPFSLCASVTFFYFLKYFRLGKLHSIDYLLALPSVIIASFSFTDFNVYLNSSNESTLGSLYPFYLAVIIFNTSIIFYTIFRSLARDASYRRLQLIYLRFGVVLALVPAVGFGAVLPLFSSSNLVNLSPVFTLFFLIFAGIAIVRHRLFDLRFAVARALGYIFSVVSIVLAYVIIAFGSFNLIFGIKLDFGKELFLAFLSAMAALFFQPVKRLFDRLSNRFFYQDAYNPQALFADLNKVLVATTELELLLTKVIDVLKVNFKTDRCVIVIREPKGAPRIIGSADHFIKEDLMVAHSRHMLSKQYDAVLVTDYLGDDAETMKRILINNGIAVMAQLRDVSRRHNEKTLGHIILGPKKSGNPYNGQDVRVIESLANELVVAVQNALRFEEIERFNETLQQKVDDATRKLRATNERLRLLDATKDDFISMASHQLRTPLTSVKGYLSLVLDGDAGPVRQAQRKLLSQAFISSQRMVFLIADLLNVSRLKTGKFIIETAPVNLADVVDEEVRQLLETAAGRSLKLTFHKPAHFPSLMLDETKTRQVVMNFIDNAIYYTPAGGQIEVSLLETPKTIELRVVDNGIGVPQAEQYHLFSKFYRAKNAQKARPDGTGLGLFMAKKVIMGQGGAIIFSSQEGRGSTFGFSIPKTKLAPTQQ